MGISSSLMSVGGWVGISSSMMCVGRWVSVGSRVGGIGGGGSGDDMVVGRSQDLMVVQGSSGIISRGVQIVGDASILLADGGEGSIDRLGVLADGASVGADHVLAGSPIGMSIDVQGSVVCRGSSVGRVGSCWNGQVSSADICHGGQEDYELERELFK